MREYKSFKEIFGDITDSKGIVFINTHNQLFEPRFFLDGRWYGLNSCCDVTFWNDYSNIWKKYTAPKKTKKVTLYSPLLKGYEDHYYIPSSCEWHTDKSNFDNIKNILGWASMEVEVEE